MSDLLRATVTPQEQPKGILARLYWVLFGNAGLVGTGAWMFYEESLVPDVFFWLFAGSLLAVRYVDIYRLHGTTFRGQRASKATWWRYSVMLLAVSAAVWGISNCV